MTARQLQARLAAGEIAELTRAAWERLAAGFEVRERHDTRLAGELLVVRGPAGLAAVERPEPGRRVVRPLASAAAVRAFVKERLAAYDRLWDG